MTDLATPAPPPGLLARKQRLFHTLRHLQPAQLGFFLLRRGLPPKPVPMVDDARLAAGRTLAPLLPVRTFATDEHAFTCLNRTEAFEEGRVNWNPAGQSRLWRYHLHYFDQLRDPRRSPANRDGLIEDWIAHNPQGSRPGWEPYTASLRIVNWSAFFLRDGARRAGGAPYIPQAWLDSLYQQTLWLERNDERHILANHYFENIKAWLFAGVLFAGADAQRWLQKGQLLLREQLREQFLADGGHYERSPHYHALMVENLLDLLNLVCSNPKCFDTATREVLRETAQRGVEFLARIAGPGGRLPLFNDSVLSGSASLEALVAYGEVVGGLTAPVVDDAALRLIEEPQSGLYGYRKGGEQLIIDCGEIGPDYQPGHTHCDFLSFEWLLEGEPVVVDSGLYEYQGGEMRRYVRSTAAHNTLTVDGEEQSEIWGEFRVARRARKQEAVIRRQGSRVTFTGSYRGFPRVAGGIEHRRELEAETEGARPFIAVRDQVLGKGRHRVCSFVHLHPAITVTEEAKGVFVLSRDGDYVAHLVVEGDALSSRLTEGWYCPDFGRRDRNPVVEMALDAPLPAQLNYRIERRT